VFGLPGDGINGIMEAVGKRQDQIQFVHVRHEESAALMAGAYAKYTGKLGVCLATSGPGGIHLLNGLYDAKMDGRPVLAITGHAFHDSIDTSGPIVYRRGRVQHTNHGDIARSECCGAGVEHARADQMGANGVSGKSGVCMQSLAN
jgi:TPP-dependent 2-oxoacid decarboxylase